MMRMGVLPGRASSGQYAHGILPVLTFDPNEPPVSRRGWKIDGAFDQEFFDHYTRIHDSFPDLSVLAAHQLSDGTDAHYSNRLMLR